MTEHQIKHMVTRFLGWKLPENFSPDAGISFNAEFNVEFNARNGLPAQRHQPVGTNLFDAQQAEAMVRYMIDGMLPASKDELAWLVERNSPAEYAYMDDCGIQWTSDPNKAMRFARRDDAEMFAAGSEDALRICEHMWCSPPTDRSEQS